MRDIKVKTTYSNDGHTKIEIPELGLSTWSYGAEDSLNAIAEMVFSYCLQLETAGLNLHKELEPLLSEGISDVKLPYTGKIQ